MNDKALKIEIELSDEERKSLKEVISKGCHKAQKFIYSLILLAVDKKVNPNPDCKVIAKVLNISSKSIERVKKKFLDQGMELCLERKQNNKEKVQKEIEILENQIIQIISKELPPKSKKFKTSRWSLRSLSIRINREKNGENISYEKVRRILSKWEIQLKKPDSYLEKMVPPV